MTRPEGPTNMLILAALVPSVEELADHAREIAEDLSPAEALEVGYVIRTTVFEVLERELGGAG